MSRLLRSQTKIEGSFNQRLIKVPQPDVIDEDSRGKRVLSTRYPASKGKPAPTARFRVLRSEGGILARITLKLIFRGDQRLFSIRQFLLSSLQFAFRFAPSGLRGAGNFVYGLGLFQRSLQNQFGLLIDHVLSMCLAGGRGQLPPISFPEAILRRLGMPPRVE